jgi:hypothetical protein
MAEKKEFRLKKAGDTRVLTWPVDIPVPLDGGQVDLQTLRVRLKVLPEAQVNALLADGVEEAVGRKPRPEGARGTPLLREVVQGFVDLRDEDSGALVPDAEAVPLVLGTTYAPAAIQAAYLDMLRGLPRKN